MSISRKVYHWILPVYTLLYKSLFFKSLSLDNHSWYCNEQDERKIEGWKLKLPLYFKYKKEEKPEKSDVTEEQIEKEQ